MTTTTTNNNNNNNNNNAVLHYQLKYRNVVQIYIALTFENFEKEYNFKYVYPNYLHVHN